MIHLVVVFCAAVLIAALSPLGEAAEAGSKVRHVGYVDPHSPSTTVPGSVDAFRERLNELGWIEGRNLVLETRWAEGQQERLPSMMSEMVRERVDVIVTNGTSAAIAAKKATQSIPVVLAGIGDPLGSGVVRSLARPDGNITGLSLEITEDLAGKYLEFLAELVLGISVVGVMGNPSSPLVKTTTSHLTTAARDRKLRIEIFGITKAQHLEPEFARATKTVQGILVLPDPLLLQNRKRVTALAAEYRLPAVYAVSEFAIDGGLLAHGVAIEPFFRRAAEYVDKILRGAKPSDLPIEQPTKFRLVTNLRTARELGIKVPESILLRSDEVIE